MGVQAIQTAPQAAPKDGGPVLPMDQAASHTAYSVAGHRVSFDNQVTPAAFSHRKALVHAAIAVLVSLLCVGGEAVADAGNAHGRAVVSASEQRQDGLSLASAPWPVALQAMRPQWAELSSPQGTDGGWPVAEVISPAQGDELERARKITEELARELQAEALRAADVEVEQKQSLEQEREKAGALARELSSVRAELAAVRAAREKLEQPDDKAASTPEKAAGVEAEGLRKSLQQERDRSKRLESDLAAAKRDAEAGAASAGKASDELGRLKQTAESAAAGLNVSLQQERKRVETLTQDLAAARRDLAKQVAVAAKAGDDATRLKQAEDAAAGLQKALQQEHDRTQALTQDLAAARRDLAKQAAVAAKAGDDATRLKQAEDAAAGSQKALQQEHDRTQALTRDLAAARRDLEAQTALANKADAEIVRQKQAAEGDAAKLKTSLQQEHDRAEALAENLSTARAAIYAGEAQTRALSAQLATVPKQAAQPDRTELRKSLQEARDRIAALEHDLADARRDVATQTTGKAKAIAESERLKQSVEQSAAERTRMARQKPDRPERSETPLPLARPVRDERVLVSVAHGTSGKSTDTPAKPVASQAAPGAGTPVDAAEAARLVARAGVLLGQGNIGATRIVLERAAEMGSAEANFALAETYDPRILPKWGAYGTRGDTAKARELYARAGAAGIKGTKERIDALPR